MKGKHRAHLNNAIYRSITAFAVVIAMLCCVQNANVFAVDSGNINKTLIYSISHETYPVSVSGLLPADARLKVKPLTEEQQAEYIKKGLNVAFAYDIKIMTGGVYNKETGLHDGEIEYQPGEANPVVVTITPQQNIASQIEVLHIAHNEQTGEEISEAVAGRITDNGNVEFVAKGFSVYIVTMTDNHEVTFVFDDSTLDVSYSATLGGTYTTLTSNTTLSANSLYFKVEGTFAEVYNIGSSSAMTPDTNGVYTLNNITANNTIAIGTVVKLNVGYGLISIGKNEGGSRQYTYTDSVGAKTGTHYASNIYIITGTTGSASAGGYNVSLIGEGDFNVILSDVTIFTGKGGGPYIGDGIYAPVATNLVSGTGNINITLDGENRLENISDNTSDSCAALEKTDNNCTLVINGNGTLYATGGADSAGIGSSDCVYGGTKNITIKGGTITATTRGSQGAGIGSGNNLPAENICIYGGNITAIGINNGAGIGGSGSVNHFAAYGEVKIYGGTINARSDGTGAGIGGGGTGSGESGTANGGNGNVYISGGTIEADRIGGGDGGNSGGLATVTISGGKVTTTGSIGGGNSLNGTGGIANITISGGTITAANISGGHGFGGSHSGGSLTVTGGSAKVTHVCSEIHTTGIDGNILSYNVILSDGATGVPNALVSSITISPALSESYGVNDVYTDENGKLYLWLPSNKTVTQVIADGDTYTGSNIVQEAALISPNSNISESTVLTASLLNGGNISSYQWQRYTGSSWSDISGATSSNYTVKDIDAGKQLLVIINGIYSLPVHVPIPSFTVTIPASLAMDTGSFNLTSNTVNLSAGHSLKVFVRSQRNFKLALTDDTTKYVTYSLFTDAAKKQQVANNSVVATFNNGTNTATLYYTIAAPAYSGTYNDTLTFTVVFDSGL